MEQLAATLIGEITALARLLQTYWLTSLMGALGVLGSLASIISWQSGRRNRKVYDRLFHLAQHAIEQEAQNAGFETKIAEKKEQAAKYEAKVQDYSDRIVAMQKQIQRDIPRAAKRVVLQDRLEGSIGLMKIYYDDVVAISAELRRLGQETVISSELLEAVKSQIRPRHVIAERMANLKTALTIVTTLVAVASTALPTPLDTLVSCALLAVAVGIIMLMLKHFVMNRKRSMVPQPGPVAEGS